MQKPVNHRHGAGGGCRRAGTTLTEVLISILIMSFGIATVATLFPISALRSAQAVKLTNATILRYNAEALIDMEPALIHNPDYDNNIIEHNGTNYIVDPVGWNTMAATPAAAAPRNFFGNYNGAVAGPARFSGGRTTLTAAEFLVTLPDSWTLLNEGTIDPATTPGTNAAGQVINVTLSADTDISDIASIVTAGSQVRLNIFSVDGKLVQSRMLSGNTLITGQKIEWRNPDNASDQTPLASFMPAAQIGRVQVEVQERRYTWLLTVRKKTLTNTEVDVVVFFKRDLLDADEKLYAAAFVKNQTQATITYNSSSEVPFKKGHWVFDANNCHWYRVQDISDPPTVSGSNASVTITLDRPAAAGSPAGGLGRAMFPRGIVDVYPIGTKPYVP